MASVTFGQSQCLKSQPVGLGRTAVALRSGPCGLHTGRAVWGSLLASAPGVGVPTPSGAHLLTGTRASSVRNGRNRQAFRLACSNFSQTRQCLLGVLWREVPWGCAVLGVGVATTESSPLSFTDGAPRPKIHWNLNGFSR